MIDSPLNPITSLHSLFLPCLLLTGRLPGVSFERSLVAHLLFVVCYHLLVESNAVIEHDIGLGLYIFGRAVDEKECYI